MKMQKLSVIFVKQKLKINIWNKYRKVRSHCHYTEECRGAADSICNLKYSVPKKIPIVFYNGSNCDYNFIIKEFSSSNLLNNLSERIYRIKCKCGHHDIKCETCGIKVLRLFSWIHKF